MSAAALLQTPQKLKFTAIYLRGNRQVEKLGQPSGLELPFQSTGRAMCYTPLQTLVC